MLGVPASRVHRERSRWFTIPSEQPFRMRQKSHPLPEARSTSESVVRESPNSRSSPRKAGSVGRHLLTRAFRVCSTCSRNLPTSLPTSASVWPDNRIRPSVHHRAKRVGAPYAARRDPRSLHLAGIVAGVPCRLRMYFASATCLPQREVDRERPLRWQGRPPSHHVEVGVSRALKTS